MIIYNKYFALYVQNQNSGKIRMLMEPQTNDNFQQCSICCEIKNRHNSSSDRLRPLQICYDCWFKHVSNVVLRIGYQVGDNVLSPFHNGSSIDIIVCLNSLKQQDSNQIEQTLFRKYNSFTKDIQKCPAEACDYVYVGGDKCHWRSKNNIYNCPKCETALTVNQGYSVKRLLASFYLLLSNKCPKCGIPIQKISGCPHMSCPCGHHFCWYCYKDHPSGNSQNPVYTQHNIPECSFIFLSKIVLFVMAMVSILLASSGSLLVDYIYNILQTIFSIVIRGLLIDGIILVQVMVVIMMMKKKRRFHHFQNTSNNYKIFFGIIATNFLLIMFLWLIDQLTTCLCILFGEILISLICFGIGYGVVFSIQTWFQFIA